MRYLKIFEEYFDFDYDKIIKVLRKTHGWGMGVMSYMDDFENSEYYLNPNNDDEYIEQFHIYLTDMQSGKLRGSYNNKSSLKLGKWRMQPLLPNPNPLSNNNFYI